MAYRAEKSGFAREAAQKVAAKWDSEAAVTALNWVSSKTDLPLPEGFNGGMEQCHEYMKSGWVLAILGNWVLPGSIAARLLNKPPTMAFKQIELIGVFVEMLKKNGFVKETELFQTVDLYESGNMPSVIITLEALGRSMQKESRGFGKAESVGEKKQWTDEQLKAGQNVIGLQMGTNKGANQSGINMGKGRAIMD